MTTLLLVLLEPYQDLTPETFFPKVHLYAILVYCHFNVLGHMPVLGFVDFLCEVPRPLFFFVCSLLVLLYLLFLNFLFFFVYRSLVFQSHYFNLLFHNDLAHLIFS